MSVLADWPLRMIEAGGQQYQSGLNCRCGTYFCYLLTLMCLLLQVNPDYDSTFLFENDFPALQPDAPDPGKLLSSLSSLKKKYFCRPFTNVVGQEVV